MEHAWQDPEVKEALYPVIELVAPGTDLTAVWIMWRMLRMKLGG
jgi:hypothetical protein